MAATTAASIPLVFEEKLVAPSYNWFGELDYGWLDNSGSLSSIPFFETASEQLAALLETSGRQELRLGFGPRDCTTASGSRNCTEACSDPTSLWTPTNFRVCTALAATALLVQNGTYSIDQTGGRAAQITETWSIPSLSTYNATGVFRHVAECLPESCILPALGDCTDTVRSLPSMDINADNLGTISSVLGHYCDGARAGINADIAGPGVSVVAKSAALKYVYGRLTASLAGYSLVYLPDEPRGPAFLPVESVYNVDSPTSRLQPKITGEVGGTSK